MPASVFRYLQAMPQVLALDLGLLPAKQCPAWAYGSILMEVTREPQALSTAPTPGESHKQRQSGSPHLGAAAQGLLYPPMELAVTPLPRPLTTPPDTSTYFIWQDHLPAASYTVQALIKLSLQLPALPKGEQQPTSLCLMYHVKLQEDWTHDIL